MQLLVVAMQNSRMEGETAKFLALTMLLSEISASEKNDWS